jgi:anti-anti-sigma factor
MTLKLSALETPVLSADVALADGVVTTHFRGTADIEAKPALDEFVAALHAEACRLSVTKVAVDLRELEFMNSSSFKALVTWLSQVQELPPDKQYRIHFVSNPSIHWQRRSLAALSCFAVNLVSIET